MWMCVSTAQGCRMLSAVGGCVTALVAVLVQPKTSTVTYIDSKHSNSERRWEAMGSPTYMNQTQISNLVAASQLSTQTLSYTPSGTTGLTFTVPLAAYSVGLVQFTGC